MYHPQIHARDDRRIPLRKRTMGPARSAFTLMELLITVTIIALLVAMVLPAVKLVRSAAGGVKCLSNLRQWSQANHFYAEEWDGFSSPTSFHGATWFTTLSTVMLSGNASSSFQKKMWRGCPDWGNTAAINWAGSNSWWNGYARNPYLRLSIRDSLITYTHDSVPNTLGGNLLPDQNKPVVFHLATITYPSERIWMGDAVGWDGAGGSSNIDPDRHRKRPSFVFMDCHASKLTAKDAAKGYTLK